MKTFPLRPLLLMALLMSRPAAGIVFYDSADPGYNTTAPTGIYDDSGWSFLGRYGSFLGAMIAPQHFITAQHMGLQGGTFTSSSVFNGSSDINYTIDFSANGGLGYYDIPGTDLRILKINEVFPGYVPLYTGAAEIGKTMVTFGLGGPRGAEVLDGATLKGWHTGAADGIARWGANVITDIQPSGAGTLIVADFDAIGGQFEATLSSGDSGGAVMILDGGQWKLAGINYGVSGFFDTNNVVGDFNEFSAALFDRGGFYEGSDSTGWNFIPDQLADNPGQLFASRISDSAASIQSIVAVPEAGPALLIALAGLTMLGRSRRWNRRAS